MNKACRLHVLSVFMVIILSSMLYGADSTAVKESPYSGMFRLWIDGGVGLNTGGFLIGTTLSVHYSRLFFSLFFDHNKESILFADKNPVEKANEIGITAGTAFYRKLVTISIGAGPVYVWGVKRGDFLNASTGWFSKDNYEKVKINTLGLSISSHCIFTFLPFIGIGCRTYCNLNVDISYAGFAVCLYWGNLQKKNL